MDTTTPYTAAAVTDTAATGAGRDRRHPPIPESLLRIGQLASPYGLVNRVTRLPVAEGEPDFPIFTASLGNPGEVLREQTGWEHNPSSGNFDGAGGDLDPERAAHLAVAESLERYSSCARDPEQIIWATAAELGEDAVTSDRWPRCSPAELADPRSGLVATDPGGPMRWVRGWSFTRNRPVYVPAVQVWLKNPVESMAERFVHPVSTGCAAHSDPAAAVVNGILEIVERDAIALTWLQRLRLPRLEFDPAELAPEFRAFVERGSSPHLRTRLYDATTDLGIPVIYGVQLADDDRVIAQLVAATAELDPGKGIAKLYREASSLRIALRHMAKAAEKDAATAAGTPMAEEDIVSVVDGALLSGPLSQRHRFDFLLEGDRPVHGLRDLPRAPSEEPLPALAWLLARLHARGCEVIGVDLTTDEAEQVGATVVRMLIPELMPLSFVHRARYLAHPRLYAAPAAMGHPVRGEADINPHPQPFA
ncbi:MULTISPECIES: YcaO-like family protein [unclassified Streptomyces]|uniref:YcaO-like family protein n=1 Tax=unclassified Streptomyces TaxID=2593676 RepID=UPI00367B189E